MLPPTLGCHGKPDRTLHLIPKPYGSTNDTVMTETTTVGSDLSSGSFTAPDLDCSGAWIKDPTLSDVLCGRGGSINSHAGNERFRELVEKRKRVYLTARFKREKRLIASSIVSEIRGLKPSGRFLSRDSKTGLWKDIGDEKARDKTSQALRENAPSIRAEIETEISEQRRDYQQEDQEVAPHGTSHPGYYAPPTWGFPAYAYPSYHQVHPAPPGGAQPPHGTPMPPPGYSYDPRGPPLPPQHYPPHYPPPGYSRDSHYPPPHSHHHTPTTQPTAQATPKSALEATAEIITSGAETLKKWTHSNLSLTGVPSNDGHDSRSTSSRSSKPIAYVHQDYTKKRRMVKFRDDYDRRTSYSPVFSGSALGGGQAHNEQIEPQNLHDQESSLMTQVADRILGSLGSWDTGTFCGGHDADDERKSFFPVSLSSNAGPPTQDEDNMAVEWEGQEVQLVDKSLESQSVASDERMPPPLVRQQPRPDQASSLGGFSSLGSCHSWLLPESAASYFSKSGASPSNSVDMGYSAVGMEQHSINGSIGGASLTRVFENEPQSTPHSPGMSLRSLSQMPSWERSLRSKSPLSIASDEDDSLISRSSSKISDGHLSPFHAPSSPMPMVNEDDMVWETKE